MTFRFPPQPFAADLAVFVVSGEQRVLEPNRGAMLDRAHRDLNPAWPRRRLEALDIGPQNREYRCGRSYPDSNHGGAPFRQAPR